MRKIAAGVITLLLLWIPTQSSAQTLQAFLKAGTDAMADEDFFSAQTYFDRALEFESDHLLANYSLAKAYFKTNDLSNAAIYFKRTLELDESGLYKEAAYDLALIQMKRGDYLAALQQLQYYSTNAGETDKSDVERNIKNCEFALEAIKNPKPVKTENLGDKINSPYSDFAAQMVADDILYFSSLRFLGKFDDVKDDSRISKILVTEFSGDKWKNAKELNTSINRPNSHNCNSAITADNKIMVFTRCNYNDDGKLLCSIYESKNVNDKWSTPTRLPSIINKRGSTNTHPHLVADGPEGYKLYFVSDRVEGLGATDIWISKRSTAGSYAEAVNAGENINSKGKEASPYFDNKTKTLFFSSDYRTGFGGYDVFRSELVDTEFSEAVNEGYPLNSGFDDIYYRPNLNGDKAVFASNREESQYITASSCCYDLYKAEFYEPELLVEEDTVLTPVQEVINRLNDYLPLKLYFHNDEPNPKTLDTTTQKSYFATYTDYIGQLDKYRSIYSRSSPDAAYAVSKIDSFFTKHVEAGYLHLDKFLEILGDQVDGGKKIRLKIRGHCSPLAANDYNVNLAKRRISSLLNYMADFENKRFENAVKEGRLQLLEIPAGESLASKSVSDDIKDKRNSIYSPAAAQERRIEISAVEID